MKRFFLEKILKNNTLFEASFLNFRILSAKFLAISCFNFANRVCIADSARFGRLFSWFAWKDSLGETSKLAGQSTVYNALCTLYSECRNASPIVNQQNIAAENYQRKLSVESMELILVARSRLCGRLNLIISAA